jgi:hypothetical protein
MPRQKYPLEPLATLRDRRLEEATGILAVTIRARDAAAGRLRAALLQRESHAKAVAGVRRVELEALGRGDLRARDLARADAWAIRAAGEREALTSVVQDARAAETKASASQGEAEASVVSRRADAQAVAGHRGRWDEARRRALEASEEEAAFEAWRPRR